MNLVARLHQQPRPVILALGVVLVAAIGMADYLTGYDVSLFVLYALPILLVVWFSGKKAGIFVCVASALAWCLADWKAGHPYANLAILTWNTTVQLGFFVLTMVAGLALKAQLEKTQAKVEELERFLLIAQISPVGIFRAGPDGECLFANQRWHNLTGLTEAEALGRCWTEALHPDDRARVAGEWERARAGPGAFQFEARLLHEGGTTAWGLGQVAPEKALHGSGFVGVMTDMTAHRRMEREILEISEREQQRIGQDLHDDLCQFLVAIQYTASSLRRDLQRQDRPEAAGAREIADLLKQAVLRTRNLARNIFPVKLEQMGLLSALQELAATATRVFEISCTFACEPPIFFGDRTNATHLYRIAQEALANAIKHGQARRVTIRLEQRDAEWLALTVENDGPGLPEPPAADGDGMGLRIMRYRAHMIGGTLQVGRGSGGGTLVSCSFRKKQLAAEVNPAID